jgi:hypothetical protein
MDDTITKLPNPLLILKLKRGLTDNGRFGTILCAPIDILLFIFHDNDTPTHGQTGSSGGIFFFKKKNIKM